MNIIGVALLIWFKRLGQIISTSVVVAVVVASREGCGFLADIVARTRTIKAVVVVVVARKARWRWLIVPVVVPRHTSGTVNVVVHFIPSKLILIIIMKAWYHCRFIPVAVHGSIFYRTTTGTVYAATTVAGVAAVSQIGRTIHIAKVTTVPE